MPVPHFFNGLLVFYHTHYVWWGGTHPSTADDAPGSAEDDPEAAGDRDSLAFIDAHDNNAGLDGARAQRNLPRRRS